VLSEIRYLKENKALVMEAEPDGSASSFFLLGEMPKKVKIYLEKPKGVAYFCGLKLNYN
jgi:hypothetical protein